MPPRIQQRVSNSLLPFLSSQSSRIVVTPSCSHLPSIDTQSSRSFSSTPAAETQLRETMYQWLRSEGSKFKNHTPGSTYYVTDAKTSKHSSTGEPIETHQPFPWNPHFKSEAVLSEDLRNEIYKRVVVKKESVRNVSADLSVDMRRVAAVCRLVEMENRMRSQGKQLALPYARTIHEMIPTTPLYESGRVQRENPHESINDLNSHRLTENQIFYPVSESRHFTRVDAGRVFSGAPARPHSAVRDETADPDAAVQRVIHKPWKIETVGKGDQEQHVLQPADVRIPHPSLIALDRDRRARPDNLREVYDKHAARIEEEETAEQERKFYAEEQREKHTDHVKPEASRFEFRFKDVVVNKETTGVDGRGAKAPGRRYGIPSYERKKGQVKIPTRVDV